MADTFSAAALAWELHPAQAAGCKAPLILRDTSSTSVGGYRGSTCAKADALRDSRAEVRVHLTPEVDRAFQHKWLDAAETADEVADEMVAVGR